MPYKDPENKIQRQRERRVKSLGEAPAGLKPLVEAPTSLTGPWLAVAEYINRPGPGMPNLERLQRIAGSLSKYADQVWFGLGGLTMEDISKVIGTLPPTIGIKS